MKTMAITKMAAVLAGVLLLLRRQEDRNQVRRPPLRREPLDTACHSSRRAVVGVPGRVRPGGATLCGGETQHYEQCPGELVLMIRLQSAEGQEKVERITHDPDALARVTGSIHEEH